MRPLLLVLSLFAATSASAQWFQWGRDGKHENAVPVQGQPLARIEADVVLDPFAPDEKAAVGGVLLVHYPAPIVDGNDVFVVVKSGQYTGNSTRETQTWNVRALRRNPGKGVTARWNYETDWKPVPSGVGGGPSWEPVYHTLVTADSVWAPGAGGTLDRISRTDGRRLARVNPFGTEVDRSIFVTGPPAADALGNIYYNAMQLDLAAPYTNDARGSWLVRIAPNGTVTKATYTSLVPNAPQPEARCAFQFNSTHPLPWPPSRDAVAPTTRCSVQRPGINVAPAIAEDGTVYTVSRSHINDRWSYLVAVNRDLTPKWAASLRNRLNDGCNVAIPANGTPGGCRADAPTGIDPSDNQAGSGRVLDTATSSPVVAPDGRVFYGAYTRYNYSQGHLMAFEPNGDYVGAYGFGWDITPSIWKHDGTYSIVMKENRYAGGSYCAGANCPSDRGSVTPWDPEQYFITQLDRDLKLEWRFRSTETQTCTRDQNGERQCVSDRPWGFEWCVNAIAVDSRGVVYANSEDGHLYAIGQGGVLRERIFLRTALGAAYTPLAIGPDGAIYTQNDGHLFIVSAPQAPKRRAVKR